MSSKSPRLFYYVLICCALVFFWPFRRAGLLPDLQPAHEQSVPAGNVTSRRPHVLRAHTVTLIDFK